MMLAVLAFIWNAHFGGPGLGDSVFAYAVASDPSGNVVVTGTIRGSPNTGFGGATLTSAGDTDIFIAKYTAAGAHSWSLRFGSTGPDVGYGIGTDSSGNVYVTGRFQGTVDFGGGPLVGQSNDIFVAKYSSAGAHIWSQRFGGTGVEVGTAISVMSNGTFAITGSYGFFGNGQTDFGGGVLTSAGQSDMFIAKYDSSGNHLWSKSIGGAGIESGMGIAIDSLGEVSATGYFGASMYLPCMAISSAGSLDGIAIKYSSSGTLMWARRFGGTTEDKGMAVALGSGGETVVTGYFNATASFGGSSHTSIGGVDTFLVKYLSAGTWSWDSAFSSSLGLEGNSNAVAMDTANNIAITGSMLQGIDFGGGALCPSCGTYDVYVAKFDSTGSHQWSNRYVATNDDHGNGIAFDPSGNVFVVGDYMEGVDFGGGTMPSPGGTDGFLVKFGP